MRGAITRAVTREDDAPIRSVAGRDVVKIGGLAGDVGDGVRAIGQAGDFVELPKEDVGVGGVARRTHDHTEERAVAVPMNARLTDCDAVGVLCPREPKPERTGKIREREIGERTNWFAQPKISTPRRIECRAEVIAKACADTEKDI